MPVGERSRDELRELPILGLGYEVYHMNMNSCNGEGYDEKIPLFNVEVARLISRMLRRTVVTII